MKRALSFLAPAIFVFLLLGGPAARAQDEQLVLSPPLREVFPLESVPGGVRVKYPVLLNDHTVLRPEAILRFIYLDPNAGARARGGGDDGPGGVGLHTRVGPGGSISSSEGGTPEHGGGASGGWGNADGNDVAGIYDGEKKDDAKQRKSELQKEVWTQTDAFTEALDRATDLGTTLVYSLPPENRPLTASLDLPEGMLLAEVAGHVQVLGLTETSRAYTGGIRPGDEIRSFNGGAAIGTLGDFLREYSATKRQARLSGNPTYAMEIWRPAEGQVVSIQIAAPPTIPTFL
jgi:hypothetical protein